MRDEELTHQTAFRLSDRMLLDLQAISKEERRSMAFMIRELLDRAIDMWKQDKLRRESGTQDDPATAARKLLDILENARQEVEKAARTDSSGSDLK